MARSTTTGTLYGLLGMVSFSLTLPATRAAVSDLHPWVVGLGRPLIAAVLALVLLVATGQRPPARRYWKNFVLVVLGVVVGVPILFAWGMEKTPAAHGAITLALLPLATGLVAVLRAGERPSRRFWWATVAGSVAVVAFALKSGAGHIQAGDVILLLSVISSAVGYAEGARLSRVMPGWQVMSWALVMGAPLLIVPLMMAVKAYGVAASPRAWWAFAYVCSVSQFAGMFAWYKAMAAGGIARVGQLQLLQPFCTILFAVLLLGETVTVSMLVAASVVVGSVVIGRRAPIRTHPPAVADEAG